GLKDVSLADALDAVLAQVGTEEDLAYEVVPMIVVGRRRGLPARPIHIKTTPYNDWTEAKDAVNRIHGTRDPNSPTGFYIPKNLEDCFAELDRMLHPEIIRKMKAEPERAMNDYHMGLGMWIRNNWGLWSETRLCDYFKPLGI